MKENNEIEKQGDGAENIHKEVVPSGVSGGGGVVDVFGDNLELVGITDSFEAQKYKKLLDAEKPVVLTDKEYDETTGRLSSSTQRVKMVEDNAIQLQALKLLSTMKGRFDKQKQKNNIQKFYGKVFVVSPRPMQEEQVVTVSVDHPMENISVPQEELVGPGWNL